MSRVKLDTGKDVVFFLWFFSSPFFKRGWGVKWDDYPV